MTVGITKVENMVVPEVMAGAISANLPNAIKFAPLANINTDLEGRPGTTLTVPKFSYIGQAENVAEGVAMGITKLETSDADFTIKKAGKAVEITDESALSGMGDPIAEAERQITLSIADKMDNDIVQALEGATLKHEKAGTFDLDVIADALDKFVDEDDEQKVIIMHPLDASVLRKEVASDWARASELGDSIIVSGTYGAVLDAQVIRSRRVKRGLAHIVKPGAVSIFMKRGVEVEKDRDILAKTTVISADEHYGVYLYDESKAVNADVRTTLTVTVTDGTDPVVGATVTVDGQTGVTVAGGVVAFKVIGGVYDVDAVDGATSGTESVTVVDGTAKAQTIVLS